MGETDTQPEPSSNIIGNSPEMNCLRKQIRKVADSDISVLLHGETGSGKEVAARELHDLSSRADQEFWAINIASLGSELVQSEIFGHKRGAFTGADSDRKGLFEIAGNGTLLLDEIGEMPMHLQTILLRAVETKKFNPVGSYEQKTLKARLVYATNKNLYREMKEAGKQLDQTIRKADVSLDADKPKAPPENGDD